MLHSLINGRVADQALAWMLTYALHSTLLLGTAWGVSRRLGGRSLALQETIWRCALVGALVTASAQLALGQLGRAPIGGRWSLVAAAAPGGRPAPVGAEVAAARVPDAAAARAADGLAGRQEGAAARAAGTGAAKAGASALGRAAAMNAGRPGAGQDAAARAADTVVEGLGASAARRADQPGTTGLAVSTATPEPAAGKGVAGLDAGTGTAGLEAGRWLASATPGAAARVAVAPGMVAPDRPGAGRQGSFRHAAGSWPRLLLPVWLAGALALSLAYARSYLLLRRRLRYRPQVVGGGVLARLAGLVRASGISRKVRLTCTWRLSVPVALGTREAEVCVPPRALFQLDDEQQDALLAHELAHLARRDPLWLPLTSLVPSFLFFQPLNWLARRRLRELSELLCDEWAVAHTGRPLSLAGCLAEVAGWSIGAPGVSGGGRKAGRLPVPGMAGRPSQLACRIRRLLDGPPLEVRAGWAQPRRAPAALPALVAAVLAAVILAAPGVSAGPPAAGLGPAAPPTGTVVASDAAAPAVAVAAQETTAVPPVAATAPAVAAAGAAVGPAGLAVAAAGPRMAAVALVTGTAPAATASSATVAKDAAVTAPAAGAPAAEPASPNPAAAASQTSAASAPDPDETAGGSAPVAGPAPSPQDLGAESQRLAAAAAHLAQLDRIATLSKEQVAAINASVDRISREIEGKLRENLDHLSHRLAAVHAHRAELPAAELAELDRELAGMAAELHPSKEELTRMDAELRRLAEHPPLSREEIERIKKEVKRSLDQVQMPPVGLNKEEMDRLRSEAHRVTEESAAMAGRFALSPAEREKLVADAHRLAEQLRPSQAQLEALRALRHDQQELRRQLSQQRAEIESMRREIQRETEAIREQARRLSETRRLTETPRVRPKRSPAPRPRAHPAPSAGDRPEPSPPGAQAPPPPPAPPASALPPAAAPPPADGAPPPPPGRR
jgi:BlaR1 peptidase M56